MAPSEWPGRLHISIEASRSAAALAGGDRSGGLSHRPGGVTNVIRHAEARTCAVRLSLGDALDVEIKDDGRGLPSDGRAGVGLTLMRERTAELGGTWRIESLPGRGTCIQARLPLPSVERKA